LWSISDLKAFLSGDWSVDRSLLDRRHSITGNFHGQAKFSAVGGSLLYHEQGMLRFGEHEGLAEQTHSFEFPNGNERACVRFRDGRPFHDLDLLKGQDIVNHMCSPDRYEGRFVALDQSHWQSSWTVSGPRKEQEIRTLYTRLAPA